MKTSEKVALSKGKNNNENLGGMAITVGGVVAISLLNIAE